MSKSYLDILEELVDVLATDASMPVTTKLKVAKEINNLMVDLFPYSD